MPFQNRMSADPNSKRSQRRQKKAQKRERQIQQRIARRAQQGTGDSAKGSENSGKDGQTQRGYKLSVKENKNFEDYYKGQNIVPPEDWDKFLEALRSPLPSTFRITGSRSQSQEMLRHVKGDYLKNIVGLKVETEDGEITIEAPKCLPWYPDELAWQLNLDRKLIRHSDVLKKLHNFLVQESESGNISRQETVSMLPPLVLDVQPHHKVLDMCAAPGSKTAQLIEMLHTDENTPVPEGFVVANDADNKRCYLMQHQVKRLQSPNFVVINHDASQLPNMRTTPLTEREKKPLKFDRVLADVPCSGDGTMRKNPDVWKKWNIHAAHHLYGLQKRILRRGIEILETGGRIVYSTCSMNPIEDEAVIATMLQETQGAVRLLDVSNLLPGLNYSPGMSTWKVRTREGKFVESLEDVPEHLKTQIIAGFFPPPPDVADLMNLSRCIRVLPHFQNTGGFFVAALEKVDEVPWLKKDKDAGQESQDSEMEDKNKEKASGEQKQEGKEDSAVTDDPNSKKRKRCDSPPPLKHQKLFGYKEDPFVFLSEEDAIYPAVKDFFGLKPSFPYDLTLVRCHEGKRRNIYYCAPFLKDLVQYNENRIRFINMGVKVLSRCESKHVECSFRLVQEGVNVMFPYLSKRIVEIQSQDIVTLLTEENPFINRLTSFAKKQISDLEQGGCLYIYDPNNDPEGPNCKLVLCGWKGKVSCRSFMPKTERAHYLRLCGHELKTKEQIFAEKGSLDSAAGLPLPNDDDLAFVYRSDEDDQASDSGTKPSDSDTVMTESDAKPMVESDTKPSDSDAVMAGSDTRPSDSDSVMAESDTKPMVECDTKPTDSDSLIAESDTKPSDSDAAIAESDIKPGDGNAVQAENDISPDDNVAVMAESNTEPSESAAVPAESDTKNSNCDAVMAESDTKPSDSDVVMTEIDTKPMAGSDTKPSDSDAIHAESDTKPSGSDSVMAESDIKPSDTNIIMAESNTKPSESCVESNVATADSDITR